MVNRHGGGQSGLNVIGLDGDLFHVGRACHADREDHLVDQEAGAHHQIGGIRGEDEFCKSIADADKNKGRDLPANTKSFEFFTSLEDQAPIARVSPR